MTTRPDPREQMHSEPGQVDPLLRKGPVRRWAVWAMCLAVAVIIGFVFYALMAPSPNAPAVRGQSAATGAPPAPATTGSGSGQGGR